MKKGLALLDRHLARHTYLVGHSATLADIVGVCNLFHGYTKARPGAPVSGGACRGLCCSLWCSLWMGGSRASPLHLVVL